MIVPPYLPYSDYYEKSLGVTLFAHNIGLSIYDKNSSREVISSMANLSKLSLIPEIANLRLMVICSSPLRL